MKKVISYMFVDHAKGESLVESAFTKEKDIINFLNHKYQRGCIFGQDNLLRFGCYKFQGWNYDFRQYLKLFLVKQHGNWIELYARNKTALKNTLYGRIEKIVELT